MAVRWHLPGVGAVIEIYDRDRPSDVDAWRETEALRWPSQILAHANDRADLARRFPEAPAAPRTA